MQAFIAGLLLLAASFNAYAAEAARTLENAIYDGRGAWHLCERGCGVSNRDWGAASLTYTAYLRWQLYRDGAAQRLLRGLAATAPEYSSCSLRSCPWSDEPAWDAVAAARIYQATHDARALRKAQGDYVYVLASATFWRGACPQIPFQHPYGADGGLKTLETTATAVKAALLLYDVTHDARYLRDAGRLYVAARGQFADPRVALYTVWVFDDGAHCRQVPRRFFASVNGEMIDNGLYLYRDTGEGRYLRDALATETAVETKLADGAGVFADLQAENDVVEPLMEAMYDLATVAHRTSAKMWILRNARAALETDRDERGWYGRFFDGPPPDWNLTAWQTNGGLALAFVAGALEPHAVPDPNPWRGARFVNHDIATLPSTIRFTGSAVAVVGTIGEHCCELGHASLLIDGAETFNRTGIWQNKSSAGIPLRNAVLFAWRWKKPGAHTIVFLPGAYNAKEGGPFLHVTGFKTAR